MSSDCNNDPKGSRCYRKQNGDQWFNYDGGSDIFNLYPRKAYLNDEPIATGDPDEIANSIIETTGNGIKTIEMPGIEQVDTTSVRIYAGERYVTDYETGDHTTATWEEQVIVDPLISTDVISFFNVDTTGGIQVTGEEQRNGNGDILCQLGIAAHNELTVIEVVSLSPVLSINYPGSIRDLWDTIKLRNIDFDGAVYTGLDSTTNRFERSAGEIGSNRGRNASMDLYSANIVEVPEQAIIETDTTAFTQAVFDAWNGPDGETIGQINLTGELDTTLRDDLSGTPVAMTDGFWGIWRIYLEPAANITIFVKPQEEHAGRIEAFNSIQTEVYSPPPATRNWLLRGYLLAKKGAVGFVGNNDAKVLPANVDGDTPLNPPTNGGESLSVPIFKSVSFTSRGVSAGEFYTFGDILYETSDITLSQASTSFGFGSTNAAYGMRPFAVFAGDGAVDAGQVGLRVTGTTITDAGVRVTSDTQVITEDITTPALNDYLETPKKFIGPVTYELYTVSGSPTTYSVSFNYGLVKYEDYGNRDFMLTDFEVTGLAGANDSAVEITLLKHSDEGWTYAATGFQAGGTVLADMSTIYGTESNLVNDEPFNFKVDRDYLTVPILGSQDEGIILRLVAGQNNTFQILNAHVGAVL